MQTAGREGNPWEHNGRSSWIVKSLFPVAMVNTGSSVVCLFLGLFFLVLEMTNRKTLWPCSCAITRATIAHSLAHHHSSSHSLTCLFSLRSMQRMSRTEKKDSCSDNWFEFNHHALFYQYLSANSPFFFRLELLWYEQLKPKEWIYQSFKGTFY